MDPDTYRSKLEDAILLFKHEVIKIQAELNVIGTKLPETEKKCDELAEEIKKLGDSEALAASREELKQKLFDKVGFKLFLQKRQAEASATLAQETMRLNTLLAQKQHFDQVHSN